MHFLCTVVAQIAHNGKSVKVQNDEELSKEKQGGSRRSEEGDSKKKNKTRGMNPPVVYKHIHRNFSESIEKIAVIAVSGDVWMPLGGSFALLWL